MSAWVVGLVLFGASSVAADCDPQRTLEVAIYATTSPPPTRVARVSEADEALGRVAQVQLSRGAVLAVRCWDSCDYTCVEPELLVGDGALLSVVAVDRLNTQTPEYALVARAAGATTLTVRTDCAEKTYQVEID